MANIETIRGGAAAAVEATSRLTKEELVVSVASLNDVTEVLSAANITEDDLWEGKTDLFPIILHYGAELLAAAMASPDHCILDIKFPSSPEFQGLSHKLYKCDPFWTVHHTVSMVCKKFGIKESRSFSLATAAGFTLQDSEPLATFGLGSLLPRWQLLLQQREGKAITRMDTSKHYAASTLRSQSQAVAALGSSAAAAGTESPRGKKPSRPTNPASVTSSKKSSSATPGSSGSTGSASGEERFPVLLLLDRSVFKYKSQRVHIRSTSSLSDLLGAVIRSHSIPASTNLLVSTVSGTILDKNGVFAEYGLGKRFQRWQLRIYAGEVPSSVTPLKSTKYAWTQLEESNVQASEARKIILELERKVDRVRRQAVRESGGSSSSSSASGGSVAAKTIAKLEAELAKARDAKSMAEKMAQDTSTQFESSLKQHMNAKANLEATVARLRDERDKFHAKAKEMEKQLASMKEHYDSKLAAQEKSLHETARKISGGKSSRRAVNKSSAAAADGSSSSKSGSASAADAGSSSSSSHHKSSDSVKVSKPKKDKLERSDKSDKSERSMESSMAEDDLIQAQAELQMVQDELAIVKKDLTHQQELANSQLESIKEETERVRAESSELRQKVAELDEQHALARADADSLRNKVDTLKTALEQEKSSRREAIEKLRDLENSQAQAEEARIEAITSKLESEMEGRYTELLASNRELYAGIEEMKHQLIETGRERDELRAQLLESFVPGAYEDGERTPRPDLLASLTSPRSDAGKDISPTSSSSTTETTLEIPASPSPPPPPAPAPAPPPIAGLPSQSSSTSSKSRKRVSQREDSVFVGLSLASKIEQGRNKLRTTSGPQKQKYTSDLEAALHKRFLAMSANMEDFEELSDDESDMSEDSAFDDDASDTSYATDSSSRALFDLQL